MSEDKFSATDSNMKKALRMIKTQGFKKTGKKVVNYLKLHKRINYMTWRSDKCLSGNEIQRQRRRAYQFIQKPLISILVPLYNTPEKFLIDMIDSVTDQTYYNWELCLVDGSDNEFDLKNVIDVNYPGEKRIKYKKLDKNYGISGNTNYALEMAEGEWIILGDHDDTISCDALYECVKRLNANPMADMIYTDEDKMRGEEYFFPHFKPDFNLDLLRSINYICHMLMIKREIAEGIEGFRSEFDGAQDYDFVLRYIERIVKREKIDNLNNLSKYILHVPKAVYHWRFHDGSTSANLDTKNYAHEAGLRALSAHYDRCGIKAVVHSGDNFSYYRTEYDISKYSKEYSPAEDPLISIIIPNKDHVDYLSKCIDSIRKQDFQNFEVIIVENNSVEEETFIYYNKLENDRAKIVRWDGEFNYSAINNYGVKFSLGKYILFMNNDTEMIDVNCLSQLLSFAERKEVGVVGARLYYPTGELQHAGVFIGYEGRAGHLFAAMKEEDGIYFNRSRMAQDLSAVTAACMMVKADVYNKIHGFDSRFKVALNDIDFCLRVRELGYLVAYNPDAKLYHAESISRGLDENPVKKQRFDSEVAMFKERWAEILEEGDPYYNENLTLEKADCSLRGNNER